MLLQEDESAMLDTFAFALRRAGLPLELLTGEGAVEAPSAERSSKEARVLHVEYILIYVGHL